MASKIIKKKLETLYKKYNRREYLHSDPLLFLYRYPNFRDQEIVGLLASSFAYGNVKQIFRSLETILKKMGPSPRAFVLSSSKESIQKSFSGFKHRWHTDKDLVLLLCGIRNVLFQYGSLCACFEEGMHQTKNELLPALSFFIKKIVSDASGMRKNLLPLPERGSSCKRLHLFLRWMIRRDEVDPGGWEGISPSKLLVPLDTHMHRISLVLKLTKRKQANLRTVQEVTESFRKIIPEDPARYDFALTRLGILKLMKELEEI